MSGTNLLLERYRRVRRGIEDAARAAGRTAADVSLLAVSKRQPASAIRALAQAGQLDFGESYLQEALPKLHELRDLNLVWHFIGQIQSNKTRTIAENFQWVHTIDRLKIAQRLNEQRPHYAPPLQACIQVKLAEESGKGGIWAEEVPALATAIATLPRLKLRGLMCIPPPTEDVGEQRQRFAKMRALLIEIGHAGLALDTLSMGMSDDFAAAIAEGATVVRMGTAVFGPRRE
jgi:pyridoxal phosphate enzyme (YggS family)